MVEINLMFAGSMLTRVGKAFMDFNIAEFAFISARAVTVIVSNEISTSATFRHWTVTHSSLAMQLLCIN
jgi:hypothetical protein